MDTIDGFLSNRCDIKFSFYSANIFLKVIVERVVGGQISDFYSLGEAVIRALSEWDDEMEVRYCGMERMVRRCVD